MRGSVAAHTLRVWVQSLDGNQRRVLDHMIGPGGLPRSATSSSSREVAEGVLRVAGVDAGRAMGEGAVEEAALPG